MMLMPWAEEYHTVLATALPGYIGRLDSPQALEALIDFMKNMAAKHLPQIRKGDSMFAVGSPQNPYLACYCLCDIGWDYASKVSAVFDKAMSDVQGQVGGTFNQFGPLPLEVLQEQYGSFEEIRKTCASMLETYHRFALTLDERQRLCVTCLELGGTAGSGGGNQEAFLVNIVQDAGPFEEQRATFEELANAARAGGRDLQRFFEGNAPLLDFLGSKVRAYFQIVLRERGRTMLDAGYLLEPIAYETVADMGLAVETLTLGSECQEQFYAGLCQYIASMREYKVQFRSLDWHWNGIESFEPECVLIVGKDYGQWDYALLRSSYRSAYPVRLPSYTEVLGLPGEGVI